MSATHSSGWNAATIAALRQLWSEGHSTAEIGRRLHMSKNAVVGKSHRLGLPTRPSPIRRDWGASPRRIARPSAQTFPLELDYPPLMLCQLGALRAYAAEHGQRWKDDLRAAWVGDTLHPALSRLRGTHGSRWLADFRLQD